MTAGLTCFGCFHRGACRGPTLASKRRPIRGAKSPPLRARHVRKERTRPGPALARAARPSASTRYGRKRDRAAPRLPGDATTVAIRSPRARHIGAPPRQSCRRRATWAPPGPDFDRGLTLAVVLASSRQPSPSSARGTVPSRIRPPSTRPPSKPCFARCSARVARCRCACQQAPPQQRSSGMQTPSFPPCTQHGLRVAGAQPRVAATAAIARPRKSCAPLPSRP